jgi:hypothetical protein
MVVVDTWWTFECQTITILDVCDLCFTPRVTIMSLVHALHYIFQMPYLFCLWQFKHDISIKTWNANITLSSWKWYHSWYVANFFIIFTNANIFKHPMMFKMFWMSMSNYGRIWCDNCKDIKTRLKTFCTSSFLESFDSSINVSILTLENFNASNSHWNLFLPFSRTWYFRGESCHIYLPIEFWITSLRWLAFPIKSIIIFSRKMELMWNSNLVENVYG